MSCTASSSWRQSSPDLTMTGRTAQAGLRPCGDSACIRLHLESNLHSTSILRQSCLRSHLSHATTEQQTKGKTLLAADAAMSAETCSQQCRHSSTWHKCSSQILHLQTQDLSPIPTSLHKQRWPLPEPSPLHPASPVPRSTQSPEDHQRYRPPHHC